MLERATQTLRNKTKQSLIGIKYINSNEQKDILNKTGSNLFDFFINEDNSIIVKSNKSGLSFKNYRMIYPAFNFPAKLNNFYRSNEIDDYKNEFDFAQKIGAILPIIYVNQFSNLKGSLELESFKKTLSYLRRNSSWIATYSGIIDWLIKKENISVKLEKIGEKPVLRLIIENRSKEKVANVGLRLILPPKYRNPETVNNNFRLRYDALTRSYHLLVPFLLANQSTIVEVHYDN